MTKIMFTSSMCQFRRIRGSAGQLLIWLLANAFVGSGAPLYAQAYLGTDLYILNTPPVFVTFYSPRHASGGQVTGVRTSVGPVFQDAVVWNGPSGGFNALSPSGDPGFSHANATNGVQQVGDAHGGFGGNFPRAVMWSSTADSIVELHPNHLGFEYSSADGIFGTQQVGAASTTPATGTGLHGHAVLWNGTAASALDLHPTNLMGIDESSAQATDGVRQVGRGSGSATGGNNHALLWNGTAASAVDLHPTNLTGIDFSAAYGVSAMQQVGEGGGTTTGGLAHALLWTGAANSAIDLHPTLLSSFDASHANSSNGMNQVGWGNNALTNNPSALLWSGTPQSAVDLSLLLPFAATSSQAYTIDADGTIWGTATDSTGAIHAVRWSPVPEPATWLLFAASTLLLLSYARRRE